MSTIMSRTPDATDVPTFAIFFLNRVDAASVLWTVFGENVQIRTELLNLLCRQAAILFQQLDSTSYFTRRPRKGCSAVVAKRGWVIIAAKPKKSHQRGSRRGLRQHIFEHCTIVSSPHWEQKVSRSSGFWSAAVVATWPLGQICATRYVPKMSSRCWAPHQSPESSVGVTEGWLRFLRQISGRDKWICLSG